MIRGMCGVSLKERQSSTELRRNLDIEAIADVMRRCRLRWHGHVERNGYADYVKAHARLVVERTDPVGRPKKTWQNTQCVYRLASAKS